MDVYISYSHRVGNTIKSKETPICVTLLDDVTSEQAPVAHLQRFSNLLSKTGVFLDHTREGQLIVIMIKCQVTLLICLNVLNFASEHVVVLFYIFL